MENNILCLQNENQEDKKLEFCVNNHKTASVKLGNEKNTKVVNENVNILKKRATELLEDIRKTKTCDVQLCNDFLKCVTTLENTNIMYENEECFDILFSIYMPLFQAFLQHATSNFGETKQSTDDLDLLMNNVFKQILTVLKDSQHLEVIRQKYASALLSYSCSLLFKQTISFDLRTKLGLIFIYTYDTCFDHNSFILCLKNVVNTSRICIHNNSKEKTENNLKYLSLINQITELYKSSDYIVIIYASILNVVSEETLLNEELNGKSLVCVLYEGILDTAKRKTAQPPLIVEISRTISIVGKYLKKLPVNLLKPMFLEGLSYVYSHLEHFVDTVRNYAKIFYDDLVSLAAYHYNLGYTELMHILIDKNKDIVENSSIKLLTYEYISKYVDCDFLVNYFKKLPEVLFTLIMQETSVSDQVCKTYINIMQKGFSEIHSEPERTEWINTWVFLAIDMLKLDANCLKFCQRIILSAFALHPTIIWQIFPIGVLGGTEEYTILLNCLNHARKNGIELTNEKDNPLYWRGLLDKRKMEMLMTHQDEGVRLLVLTCIVETLKTTEFYLDWEFIFLINYIRYNITFQSANARKHLVTCYKKALFRYDASYKVILRNIQHPPKNLINQKDTAKILELKKSYRRFICNFTRVLVGNLSYDSNFPRRACSLELLLVIRDILQPEEWRSYWTDEDVKNSHNILFDTYESNKKMIVAILKTLPPHYLGFTNINFTSKYLQRSFDLALDVKPSRSLTAAYLFEVCSFSPFFLQLVQANSTENNKISHAETQDPTLTMIILLTKRFINQPLTEKLEEMQCCSTYGLMLALRRLLETKDTSSLDITTYSCMFHLVIAKCFEIKNKIMPVVCNPSPEGYLPPDNSSEDVITESDETSRAQMIVVYAWRTMKEMTLLLAEIVRKIIKSTVQEKDILKKNKLVIEIGEFFVELFLESKHRGVFEQAYIGFSKICETFWACNHCEVSSLPQKWLEMSVELCTGQKSRNTLCPTRRSAGLPFLMLSILSTEPTYGKQNFHRTMQSLLKAAETSDINNEVKTHCMNVLRAIFRHSKLGELVAPYVAKGVILAVKGFKDECWGIRNSATLLYSALITRMFGVQRTQNTEELCSKNRLTVRVFFLRYPELFEFLLDTLAKECRNSDSLILHPVLMILARLYPSQFEEHNSKMDLYLPYVNECLSNIVFRTRELAARASVSFINSSNVAQTLEKCFDVLGKSEDVRNNNEIHGVLLQVLHLVKNNTLENIPLTKYLQTSLHFLKLVDQKYSPILVNLYMEIIIQLMYSESHLAEDVETYKEILNIFSGYIQNNYVPSIASEKFIENQTILSLIIVLNKLEKTDITYACVSNQILALLYSENEDLNKFALYFLIVLNQSLYIELDKSYKKHALFECEELEIPQNITELVDSFDSNTISNVLRDTHKAINGFICENLEKCGLEDGEEQVLFFLLAEFYPCAYRFWKPSKQETLNCFLKYCESGNEQLSSAVLAVVSVFLSEELDSSIKKYQNLVKILSKNASPAATVHQRLSVCEFLCDLLCTIFCIVMVLLEDDEIEVRNSISNFESSFRLRFKSSSSQTLSGQDWPVVPEKAKEDLLYLATLLLPKQQTISLLFSWACRHFPDRSSEPFEIFERGDLNSYAENTPLIDVCSRILIKMLWTLPEGLNYEDHSVFLEEQTLIVTTLLLDSLEKYESPMMSKKTKTSVICALKSIFKFSERFEVSSNFAAKFRAYMGETIMHYLTSHLEHSDLFCVKRFIRKLYDPVFK